MEIGVPVAYWHQNDITRLQHLSQNPKPQPNSQNLASDSLGLFLVFDVSIWANPCLPGWMYQGHQLWRASRPCEIRSGGGDWYGKAAAAVCLELCFFWERCMEKNISAYIYIYIRIIVCIIYRYKSTYNNMWILLSVPDDHVNHMFGHRALKALAQNISGVKMAAPCVPNCAGGWYDSRKAQNDWRRKLGVQDV